MKEYEVELAIKMITYAIFSSTEAKDLRICDVDYHLRFFFTEDVLKEARNRCINAK